MINEQLKAKRYTDPDSSPYITAT